MLPSEFRRQGAVSGAFLVRVSVFTVVLYGLVFGVLGFVHYEIARRDLMAAREIWKVREPLYNNVQAMKHDLAEIKKIQQELEGWRRARLRWDERLLTLQKIVPSAMQMRRLSIRGDQELVKEKGTQSAIGVPARRYIIDVDGKIVGEEANVLVNRFLADFEKSDAYANVLQSLTLQGLRREAKMESDLPEWSFSVQAISTRQAFQ
jgi:hypothetical protein